MASEYTGGEVDLYAWYPTISSSEGASFLTSPPVSREDDPRAAWQQQPC
jgi:hypothetical protein